MNTPMPIEAAHANDKEVNYLKKMKAKTMRMKLLVSILAVVLLSLGIFIFSFFIGSAVRSENITITTEIQQPSYQAYLDKEWVVHFTLTNGKAIVPKSEPVYETDAEGNKLETGCIIQLYDVQATNWVHETESYTWSYFVAANEVPPEDYTVTVRLKDKDIVFSMATELFER